MTQSSNNADIVRSPTKETTKPTAKHNHLCDACDQNTHLAMKNKDINCAFLKNSTPGVNLDYETVTWKNSQAYANLQKESNGSQHFLPHLKKDQTSKTDSSTKYKPNKSSTPPAKKKKRGMRYCTPTFTRSITNPPLTKRTTTMYFLLPDQTPKPFEVLLDSGADEDLYL